MNEGDGIFRILCGLSLGESNKFKGCQIAFDVRSESSYKAENLGLFAISSFIQFDTIIMFDDRKTSCFKLNVLLRRKNKTIGAGTMEIRDFQGNKIVRKLLKINDFTILILFIFNWQFIYNRPLDISVMVEEKEIRKPELLNADLDKLCFTKNSYVFKATLEAETYAIKLVDVYSPKNYENFIRELSLYLMVFHSNIIKFTSYCIIGNMFGFVLDYAENGSLRDYEKKLDFKKSMTEICSAMSWLHSLGIVHRDLKPGNILIDSNLDIKLADFGISRKCEKDMTSNMGTCDFMAPEVSSGSYSYSTDVYSAGVVACFVLDRDNCMKNVKLIKEGRHVQSLPYQTQAILRAMLSENPHDRPTFTEIIHLLDKNYFFTIDDSKNDYETEIYRHYN